MRNDENLIPRSTGPDEPQGGAGGYGDDRYPKGPSQQPPVVAAQGHLDLLDHQEEGVDGGEGDEQGLGQDKDRQEEGEGHTDDVRRVVAHSLHVGVIQHVAKGGRNRRVSRV